MSENYSTLHRWVQRHFERSGRCEHCGQKGRTEWASRDHVYTRRREDWLELCKPCHVTYDGNTVGERERAKTHCPHGHAYTPENTRLYRGRRFCRECHRTRSRERMRRKRAAA